MITYRYSINNTNLIYYVVQKFEVIFLFRRFKKLLHSSTLRNYFLKKYEQKRIRRLDYVIYQFGINGVSFIFIPFSIIPRGIKNILMQGIMLLVLMNVFVNQYYIIHKVFLLHE
jgi:hypothetical protein